MDIEAYMSRKNIVFRSYVSFIYYTEFYLITINYVCNDYHQSPYLSPWHVQAKSLIKYDKAFFKT